MAVVESILKIGGRLRQLHDKSSALLPCIYLKQEHGVFESAKLALLENCLLKSHDHFVPGRDIIQSGDPQYRHVD